MWLLVITCQCEWSKKHQLWMCLWMIDHRVTNWDRTHTPASGWHQSIVFLQGKIKQKRRKACPLLKFCFPECYCPCCHIHGHWCPGLSFLQPPNTDSHLYPPGGHQTSDLGLGLYPCTTPFTCWVAAGSSHFWSLRWFLFLLIL